MTNNSVTSFLLFRLPCLPVFFLYTLDKLIPVRTCIDRPLCGTVEDKKKAAWYVIEEPESAKMPLLNILSENVNSFTFECYRTPKIASENSK